VVHPRAQPADGVHVAARGTGRVGRWGGRWAASDPLLRRAPDPGCRCTASCWERGVTVRPHSKARHTALYRACATPCCDAEAEVVAVLMDEAHSAPVMLTSTIPVLDPARTSHRQTVLSVAPVASVSNAPAGREGRTEGRTCSVVKVGWPGRQAHGGMGKQAMHCIDCLGTRDGGQGFRMGAT